MKRILIAAAATVALAGVAAAQEAPVQVGNQSAAASAPEQSVQGTYNNAPRGVDYSTTASVNNGATRGASNGQTDGFPFAHR